uniref:Uncharacterized protein n=1 Tax=Anguilla anguilla TaxID=7936 RepID=A0A0E9RJM7_ANGAN
MNSTVQTDVQKQSNFTVVCSSSVFSPFRLYIKMQLLYSLNDIPTVYPCHLIPLYGLLYSVGQL